MTAAAPGGAPAESGPIDTYLDTLFDRLAGTNADGRRMLADAEEHLLAAAAEGRAAGLGAEEAERRAVERFGPSGPLARQVPFAAMTMGTALRRTAVAGCIVTGAGLLWYGTAGVVTWLIGWLLVDYDVSGGRMLASCRAALSPADCRKFAHQQLFTPMWTGGADGFLAATVAGAALLLALFLVRRSGWLVGPRWTPSAEAVTLGIALPAAAGALYLIPHGVSGFVVEPAQSWALAYVCCGVLALLLAGAALIGWRRAVRAGRSRVRT